MACRFTKVALLVLLSIIIAIIAIVLQQPETDNIPDLNKTIQQLITSRGFESETHWIQSQDGYLLQNIRIINPTIKDRSTLKPVLLHHGFQCSGSLWLVAADGRLQSNGKYFEEAVHKTNPEGVGNSLGFVLATSGYDVWLANYRGNIYSRNHTTLNPNGDAFWKFSIDDMIANDLPAQIEYIRKATNRKTISYIGHSQGNYMMFGLLASQPKFSQTIKPFIALSPVSYFTHFSAPMGLLKYVRRQLLWLRPRDSVTQLFQKLHIPTLCANPLLQNTVCNLLYWVLTGSPRSEFNLKRLPVYLDNLMAGASTRNHVQLLQHNYAHVKYNFDEEEPGRNLREYGTEFPPIYKYSAINSSDIALFYTKKDWFLHLVDLHLLKQHLNVKLLDDYLLPGETWNHMELVWGKEVGKYVNTKVLQLLEKY